LSGLPICLHIKGMQSILNFSACCVDTVVVRCCGPARGDQMFKVLARSSLATAMTVLTACLQDSPPPAPIFMTATATDNGGGNPANDPNEPPSFQPQIPNVSSATSTSTSTLGFSSISLMVTSDCASSSSCHGAGSSQTSYTTEPGWDHDCPNIVNQLNQ